MIHPTSSFHDWKPGDPVVVLDDDVIFVSGSNRAGIHGKGSARTAYDHYGAKWGQGEGLRGQSYSLPTCSVPGMELTIEEIKCHVEIFRRFVQSSTYRFYVTAVGCGYAGYKHKDIAPLFQGFERCIFPREWEPYL